MEMQQTQSQGQTKKCPKCKEEIMKDAVLCKHCGTKIVGSARKNLGIGCLAIFIIIIAVIAVNSGNDNNNTSSNGSNIIEKIGNSEQEEVIPTPEPIKLSGTGQNASQKFNLESGLSIFKMTHNGTSNFSMTLMDSDGQNVELLVNEIGKFDGAKAVGITKKGEYVLDISANEKWTVEIEQPRPTTADVKPKTFTGVGQQVSTFIKLDKGLTTFKLKHTGKSNFSVLLMDKKGNREELLVNEIGDFDGSKAVGISSADLYLLDISADGNWSIIIE